MNRIPLRIALEKSRRGFGHQWPQTSSYLWSPVPRIARNGTRLRIRRRGGSRPSHDRGRRDLTSAPNRLARTAGRGAAARNWPRARCGSVTPRPPNGAQSAACPPRVDAPVGVMPGDGAGLGAGSVRVRPAQRGPTRRANVSRSDRNHGRFVPSRHPAAARIGGSRTEGRGRVGFARARGLGHRRGRWMPRPATVSWLG